MEGRNPLHRLRDHGRIHWIDGAQAWRGEPDEVVNALAADGFEECKREVARTPRNGLITGGVWQGLDPHTGATASTVWFQGPTTDTSLLFVTINGHPLKDS